MMTPGALVGRRTGALVVALRARIPALTSRRQYAINADHELIDQAAHRRIAYDQ